MTLLAIYFISPKCNFSSNILRHLNIFSHLGYWDIRRWDIVTSTLKKLWHDVVQGWKSITFTLGNVTLTSDTGVVSTLCSIENPTSDFVSFSTSDRRYFNVNTQCWNNVDQKLKCWLSSTGTSYISRFLLNQLHICKILFASLQRLMLRHEILY